MRTIAKQQKDVAQGTKKHIIDTARRFFSEYSYLGVSMNDIAKKLNITKAALYYHFKSKVEIYQRVLDDVFEDLSSTIFQALDQAPVDKKLHQVIKSYLDFGFKEKNFIKALMLKLSPSNNKITKHIARLRERVAGLIQPVIEEMSSRKKQTKKLDSQFLTSMLTGMMDGLLLEYSFLNKKMDSEKISKQIMAVLF